MRKFIIITLALTLSVYAFAQDNVVRHIDSKQFNEQISDISKAWAFKGDKAAIVDFYATWCGPCKKLSPILEKVAGEFKGKVDVYKVDVDECGDLASAFRIRSIPTLMFISADGKVETHVGMMSEEKLREKFTELSNK